MEELAAVTQKLINFGSIVSAVVLLFIISAFLLVVWVCFKDAICSKFHYWYARLSALNKKGSS